MGAGSARLVGMWGLAGNCWGLVNIHLGGVEKFTPLFHFWFCGVMLCAVVGCGGHTECVPGFTIFRGELCVKNREKFNGDKDLRIALSLS